jgi:polyisoprenoid-binding protein YceI
MTLVKLRSTALAAALLMAGLSANAQQGASHTPSEVQSGSYAVETGHTQIGFTLSHMGFSSYSGRLNGVTGSLTLSATDPASSKLSVTVPAASFSTTSEKLDEELRGDKWFDAAKFPTITFTSTKVTVTGTGTATVAGDLTMHGVTKPVVLTAHFVGAGTNPLNKKYTVGFDVTGSVKRSDFGVTTYVPLIGDEVTLTIAGAFEKQN